MLLTTDSLDPERFDKLAEFSPSVLPADYVEFIKTYGAGEYWSEVQIQYPDKEIIPSYFEYDAEYWDFDERFVAEDLLSSIQIGQTSDGDVICVTAQRRGKVFVLPRHSVTIKSFDSFFAAAKSVLPENAGTEYFDPHFDRQTELINLIKDAALINVLPIYEDFLKSYKYDFVVGGHEKQPKYVFKKFGGWVYFDFIYKNTLGVKFQKQHSEKVAPIIEFLKQKAK